MFGCSDVGCLPLDGPHREGGLLAGLRTYGPATVASVPDLATEKSKRHLK